LAQIKANCRALLLQIQLFTAFTQAFSTCEYYENHHGYQVTRSVELYRNEIELPKGWNGIKQFVKVRRYGYRNGKRFDYVSTHQVKNLTQLMKLRKPYKGIGPLRIICIG